MNNIKIFSLLFLIFLFWTSCEKDDFCTKDPVTPKLVLRFYDRKDSVTIKPVEKLTVWAAGKDSLIVNRSLDSLAIPLNSSTTETIYNFSNDTLVNQLTIRYTPTQIFVSRSCGFKINFSDVSFTSNNTWFTTIFSTVTTIDNQNSAHVQILH